MNFTFARRYIEGLFTLWILTSNNFVRTDPGHDFLTSIINELKEKRPVENHHLFYDELLKVKSRSADDDQIQENIQDSQGNAFPQFQSNEFDSNQNAFNLPVQQFNPWQNLANPVAGNDPLVNLQSVFPSDPSHQGLPESTNFQQGLPESTNFQGFPVGLKPSELNNYLNFSPQQLQQPSLPDPAFDLTTAVNQLALNPQDNTGPNLFNPAVDVSQSQSAAPAYNYLAGNTNAAQQSTLPGLLLSNGLANALQSRPLQAMYNHFHPDHAINDNLIDDTFNAMRPYADEQSIDGPSKQFMVEPLFVAMAGFVGVAMIFMSAILFLPKLLTPPPEVSSLKGPQELAALTKLAVQTIEGNDCTERIACEVGRAMRSLHVSGKPIEVLEVLVSKNVASQLARIRKAIANKQVCRLIQCKPLKSIGYSAAQKSKSAVELKLPKTESNPLPKVKLTDKAKPNTQTKEKQSPEPRLDSTTTHSVVKKTLKAELEFESTTRKRTTLKPLIRTNTTEIFIR